MALPTRFQFLSDLQLGVPPAGWRCTICLNDSSNGRVVRVSSTHGCYFHYRCLRTWTKQLDIDQVVQLKYSLCVNDRIPLFKAIRLPDACDTVDWLPGFVPDGELDLVILSLSNSISRLQAIRAETGTGTPNDVGERYYKNRVLIKNTRTVCTKLEVDLAWFPPRFYPKQQSLELKGILTNWDAEFLQVAHSIIPSAMESLRGELGFCQAILTSTQMPHPARIRELRIIMNAIQSILNGITSSVIYQAFVGGSPLPRIGYWQIYSEIRFANDRVSQDYGEIIGIFYYQVQQSQRNMLGIAPS